MVKGRSFRCRVTLNLAAAIVFRAAEVDAAAAVVVRARTDKLVYLSPRSRS
jgi:hypothetical protein